MDRPKYERIPYEKVACRGIHEEPRRSGVVEREEAEVPLPAQENGLARATPQAAFRVLQPDEIMGPIRDASSGAELIAQSMAPPRNGRQFERESRRVAAGWSNLARAARAQADVRNAVALSVQRGAEIGAAVKKVCADAAVHHAQAMDQIHAIHDGATVREATRDERIAAAVAQARLEREKAMRETEEVRARSAATCAQQRLAAASAEAQRASLVIGRNREERRAREEARCESLASGHRARTFIEEAALEYDQVCTRRLDLRAQTEGSRYDAAFARNRSTPTPAGAATEADTESVIERLGTPATRNELRQFLYPAVHGDDTCHPIAPVVRLVYRDQRALQGKPELDAIREAARAALTFLATPREQWPVNLSEQYRERLARLEGQIAAKEARELRDLIDREQSVFHGTEPFASPRF